MNSKKYKGRLPALRVDAAIVEALQKSAARQRITLAEAHRQALSRALLGPKVIPVVGKVIDGEVFYYEQKEAA